MVSRDSGIHLQYVLLLPPEIYLVILVRAAIKFATLISSQLIRANVVLEP